MNPDFFYECHNCKQKIPVTFSNHTDVKMVMGKKPYEWLFECNDCSAERSNES